jgi:hypothetical protein
VPRWRLSRTISVVRTRGVPLRPPAQRFLDLLRETFAAAEAPPNSNLPALETALLGRHSEVEELIGLVGGGERTVTLTGAGGSGKTRLAIDVAARLVDDFPDGVYLVDLAPLRDPALVPATIAEVLAAGDADELERRLERKRVLLVLDNFEHLLEAAPVVAALAAALPELAIIVTSHVPLGIPGERRYRVEPLALDDAVTLLVERARAVNPRFGAGAAARRICERLDRLPLALELAAARARGTTAARLAERLEARLPVLAGRHDAPARQRTLTAAIAWSHDLLDEPQRELLARLAVFAGGWASESAEATSNRSRSCSSALPSSIASRATPRECTAVSWASAISRSSAPTRAPPSPATCRHSRACGARDRLLTSSTRAPASPPSPRWPAVAKPPLASGASSSGSMTTPILGTRQSPTTSGRPGSARTMRQDVDDRAAGLTKHEAPDSPLLVAKRVRDLEALLDGLRVNGIDVSHLHRDARRRHVIAGDDGHLRRRIGRRREGHDPAQVHRHLEAEEVHEEIARLRGAVGPYVRHRPVDRHARVVAQTALSSYWFGQVANAASSESIRRV